MSDRIGFMQGRLSPVVGGRIQAFPWASWREEFPLAERLGLRLMEWTLDHDGLYQNPLLTSGGVAEILVLCRRHEVAIPSLTGDCFMQAPFWKGQGSERDTLGRDFLAVADACAAVGISIIVLPLVDNGRLENAGQEDILVTFLHRHAEFLAVRGLRVVFETDLAPADVARFIGRLDPAVFGINYDIGNSASLGFNPAEELAAYGRNIVNVHVKDRTLGGSTVPLGTGDADFETVFAELARAGYAGNYILQTARAADADHSSAMCRYRDMTEEWLRRHGS